MNAVKAYLYTAATAAVFLLVLWGTMGLPEPYVHDEFAYLFGADTFLEGRLTNPTPPVPEAFETFQINVEPTYHSKYPPAQSVVLALGILMFGHPVYGVWLSFILAALAVVWALQALVPDRWAFLGGLLSAVNITLLIKWAFSYWGGSVAMLGGALFMGGLIRIYQQPRYRFSLPLCSGLILMAFSRPLEGLLTAAPLLLYCFAAVILQNRERSPLRTYGPVFGTVCLTGILILLLNLFYNHTLTGDMFLFPHRLWTAATASDPIIQAYTGSAQTTFLFRIGRLFITFVGPVLWIPLIVAVRKTAPPVVIPAAISFLGVILFASLTSRAWPHYVAPAVPLAIGLIVVGCKRLSEWRVRGLAAGPACFALLLVLHFSNELAGLIHYAPRTIHFEASRKNGMTFKGDLDQFFEGKPGNHLVLVHYLEGHALSWEFVYNRADLSSAKVIWARDVSPKKNRMLFEAYPDRQKWFMTVRTRPIDLISLPDGKIPEIPVME
jgi:hypothetical protein